MALLRFGVITQAKAAGSSVQSAGRVLERRYSRRNLRKENLEEDTFLSRSLKLIASIALHAVTYT